MTESLAEIYEKYFEIYPQVDKAPEQLAEVYRLRFQVYCVENPFEDSSYHPDGLEKDPFDDCSIHSLLVHRQTSLAAGTVRLVLPSEDNPALTLPINQLCREPLLNDLNLLPRSTLAEVSRFAVSKNFRRRLGEASSPSGVSTEWHEAQAREQGRKIPHLCLGLIQALVGNSYKYGVTHWSAVMEPALLRMLKRVGIHFINSGPLIEYHGWRQPCYAELAPMLSQVKQERPDVWELITDYGRYGQ
ncbi:PEP-CTERM/exosortase system-associated acyltransferase [Nitrosococcus oceani]|uniref:PEP-CTERM/exosortase system-associated acyltransferase n=1 Tax=Nitrosococcus oceani TaxID=1229 RepID=UPI0004E8C593|nr:PEP-CTERM/exosortase system-associated acyltransferase [Nitrosococcus oceani]KFI22887.1 hypothetical protein HW44_06725 [Nitrosococcus oceani]